LIACENFSSIENNKDSALLLLCKIKLLLTDFIWLTVCTKQSGSELAVSWLLFSPFFYKLLVSKGGGSCLDVVRHRHFPSTSFSFSLLSMFLMLVSDQLHFCLCNRHMCNRPRSISVAFVVHSSLLRCHSSPLLTLLHLCSLCHRHFGVTALRDCHMCNCPQLRLHGVHGAVLAGGDVGGAAGVRRVPHHRPQRECQEGRKKNTVFY
jgi:hypothetical protein